MRSRVLALALAISAIAVGNTPASAADDACSEAQVWPSFDEVATSAHSIYIARVTAALDGVATEARAGEIMRGGAPGKVDLRDLRPGTTDAACAPPEGPVADVGDRLLIAYDGTAAERTGSVDAFARIGQEPEGGDPSGTEWLTLKEARAYERIERVRPPTQPSPTPERWSPRPSGLPAIAHDGEALWSCNGHAPGFPISVIDGPAGVEAMEGAVFDALRRGLEIMHPEFEFLPREDRPGQLPWRLAYEGEDLALFLVRRTGGEQHYSALYVEPEGGAWRFSGYSDPCVLRPLITHEHGRSVWRVKPGATVSPETSSIEVQVREDACASGQRATGRIVTPIVDLRPDAITVTIPVRGIEAREATCQGNPWTSYVLELEEPIGDRVLLDGGPWPPQQRWPAAAPDGE